MSDTSVEVLLDDFEKKDDWDLIGAGADTTHLTTFVEGAPNKRPGVYADGGKGADHRALVLLIRSAAAGFEVELVRRPGHEFSVTGRVSGVSLWVRTPHAALEIAARLRDGSGETRDVVLGTAPIDGEWRRLEHEVGEPFTDAELLGLRIRLEDVVERPGEVMILLDDLSALTTG
ncbi:hypothetical protein [Nocardia paucivorans]|uniref:hypothetical protein n=1 Tax=Nocardia paucivorans TaxID=114259 RepID=UPI0002E53561|nr:hypothetical protein [Nocardia paucivorans]